MNVNDLFNKPVADRPAALKSYGVRLHRADYPGTLAEARTATTRFCDGFTPTHRGVPRNA